MFQFVISLIHTEHYTVTSLNYTVQEACRDFQEGAIRTAVLPDSVWTDSDTLGRMAITRSHGLNIN